MTSAVTPSAQVTGPPPTAEKSGTKLSMGASRARVVSLVEDLERHMIAMNARGVRATTDALRIELVEKSPLAALEAGALQALTGTLNYARKDEVVTETVLSAAAALGKRPTLSNDSSVSIALLLRSEGLSIILEAAAAHKQNIKIRALALKVLVNCCVDEQGSRIAIHSNGCAFLLDTMRKLGTERILVLNSLSALANCCIFHLSARATLLGELDAVGMLCNICRMFKSDADIVEYTLCVLCMISTGKTGAKALLARPFVNSGNADIVPSCSVDVASIALDALSNFALRSYHKSTEESKTGASSDSSSNPLNVFKNGFQRLATAASPASMVMQTPPTAVVTSHERRCGAWALMLLHNLAIETNDVLIRREIAFSLQKQTNEGSRDLHRRIVAKLTGMVLHSSENIQDEEDVLEPSSLVDMIACPGEDLQDGSVLPVLFNFYFAGRRYQGPTVLLLIQQIHSALLNEIRSSSMKPLPVSPSATRLLTYLFALLVQPYTREKLDAGVFEFLTQSVLETLRSGDPPEYFQIVARALEVCIGNRSTSLPWVPYRSFPLSAPTAMVTMMATPTSTPSGNITNNLSTTTPTKTPSKSSISQTVPSTPPPVNPSPSISSTPPPPYNQVLTASTSGVNSTPVNSTPLAISAPQPPSAAPSAQFSSLDLSTEFTLFDWRFNSKEICRQITLKMERLYASVNPCTLCLPAASSSETFLNTADDIQPEERFLRFHNALIKYFKQEILSRADPSERASMIECLIDVASMSATKAISNLDLTIICLQCLESPSIKRMDICWGKVRTASLQVLGELKSLSSFQDLQEIITIGRSPPPRLLRAPKLPYLEGCMSALKALNDATISLETPTSKRDELSMRYLCLNWWLPRVDKNGDWAPHSHMFSPIPAVQMVLSKLLDTTISYSSSEAAQALHTNSRALDGDDANLLSFGDEPAGGYSDIKQDQSGVQAMSSLYIETTTEEDFMQFSLALEPQWALEQAELEDSVLVKVRVERLLDAFPTDGSITFEAQSLAAFRKAPIETQTIINYGKMCKALGTEILQREDFKVYRKRYEIPVRAAVERIVLGPVWSRLMLVSVQATKQQEQSLVNNIDQLRGFGYERQCEMLGVIASLRLPWRSAISSLDMLSSGTEVLPFQALEIILKVKDEIFAEAKQNNVRDMSADDLLPVLALVVSSSLRARALCAHCNLLRQFYGDELASGEAAYYLVTLESAIHQICHII